MDGTTKKRWADLGPVSKLAVVVAAAVQFALAGAAWADLARRPADQVRGPRWRWALVVLVNFVGPLAYFRWGRVIPGPTPDAPAACDAKEHRRHPDQGAGFHHRRHDDAPRGVVPGAADQSGS